MKFDQAFIDEQKEKLLAAKAELESEMKDLEVMPDMGDDTDSFEEEADEAEEYVTNLSKSNDLKKDLDEVNDALKKMEKGMYGVCEEGGEQIEKEVLEVAPESRYCKQHKLSRRGKADS